MARPRRILVTDQSHKLPYSKGLMASSITAAGLTPGKAFKVAEAIEDRLVSTHVRSLTTNELGELAAQVIESEVGEHFATNYRRWQTLNAIDVPLVILIGGTTGVGKSTIATQLASRLGITRVIPTDAIREVMRGMLTREMMPSLHTSSFDAESLITQPLPRSADKVIIGYREQAQAVCVGVDSLISRAVTEGTDLIVEGAHACPGFFREPAPGEAVFVPLIITIADEDVHRSHFAFRSREAGRRPPERYLKHFTNIRKIQKYIKKAASKNEVAQVESFDLDETLAECTDIVLDRVAETVAAAQPKPAVKAMPKQKTGAKSKATGKSAARTKTGDRP